MVIPDLVVVVDNSSAEAPGWVDTSSGDGDGGQVNHENSEPNRKRSQYLHVLTSKISQSAKKFNAYVRRYKNKYICIYYV